MLLEVISAQIKTRDFERGESFPHAHMAPPINVACVVVTRRIKFHWIIIYPHAVKTNRARARYSFVRSRCSFASIRSCHNCSRKLSFSSEFWCERSLISFLFLCWMKTQTTAKKKRCFNLQILYRHLMIISRNSSYLILISPAYLSSRALNSSVYFWIWMQVMMNWSREIFLLFAS